VTDSFLSDADTHVMRARQESPRANYATLALRNETTRALRRRQLPTNHGHAALSFRTTRAYQPDSSSKPPHHPLRVGALRNFAQTRGSGPPQKPLEVSMPWTETAPMKERMRFVTDWERDLYSMVELCERYGVSRKTGYKWIGRDEGTARTGCTSEAAPRIIARTGWPLTSRRPSAPGAGSIRVGGRTRSCTG
jgi:hypothetical protein